MALKDQLKQIWDSFSVRKPSQGASSFKPDILSDTLRNRILMLYADVMSGRMNDKLYRLGHEDHRAEFWEEMHHSLRHLYGRPVLASQQVQSAVEDALRFVQGCSAEEFFDFIELSFKVQCATRALQDENDFVDALNEIFCREHAPYQVTPGVFRVGSEADRKSRPVGPVVGPAGVILGRRHHRPMEQQQARDEYPRRVNVAFAAGRYPTRPTGSNPRRLMTKEFSGRFTRYMLREKGAGNHDEYSGVATRKSAIRNSSRGPGDTVDFNILRSTQM